MPCAPQVSKRIGDDMMKKFSCFEHARREIFARIFNPLNPICHLLALLGAHHILHISWIRVKTMPSQ